MLSSQSDESSSSDEDIDSAQPLRQPLPDSGPSQPIANEKSSPSLQPQVEVDSSSRSSSPNLIPPGSPALRRSRSPVVKPLSNSQATGTGRVPVPNTLTRHKFHINTAPLRCLLPSTFCISLPSPWGRHVRKVSGDFRKAGENIILLLSLLYGISKITDDNDIANFWIAIGKWDNSSVVARTDCSLQSFLVLFFFL